MKKIMPVRSIYEYYNDESPTAVEFRRLAKKIKSYGNPKEIKSILVTSSVKNEGKSLIVANLGITMAKREEDKNILIVDCDLHRPTQHLLFNIKREPGMVSLLNGNATLNDVINNTELENLKIITSGYSNGLPSQLLKGIKDVLDKCKESFDIIICDSPPVVPIDDAGIVASCVDGVLLVVMAGKTDRNIVKRAVDILDNTKVKILGIVLNNVKGVLPYYYDYGYYHYEYSNKLKIK